MFDIVSDLHFDNGMNDAPVGQMKTIDVAKYKNPEANVLLVGGDTAERESDAIEFLNNAAQHYDFVVGILGNHEKPGGEMPLLKPNAKLLDRRFNIERHKQIGFVGGAPLDKDAEKRIISTFAALQDAVAVERVVLLVHHVPSKRFSEIAGRDIDNKTINLLEKLGKVRKPTLLVFGHVHLRLEGEIDGMRFVSNPRGYRGKLRDGSNWNGRFLFEP